METYIKQASNKVCTVIKRGGCSWFSTTAAIQFHPFESRLCGHDTSTEISHKFLPLSLEQGDLKVVVTLKVAQWLQLVAAKEELEISFPF